MQALTSAEAESPPPDVEAAIDVDSFAGAEGELAAGEIGSDGTFSVRTFLEAQEAAGAVAGPHRVIIEPANLRPGEPPIVLPEPILVEPRENMIDLKVDRPHRG